MMLLVPKIVKALDYVLGFSYILYLVKPQKAVQHPKRIAKGSVQCSFIF